MSRRRRRRQPDSPFVRPGISPWRFWSVVVILALAVWGVWAGIEAWHAARATFVRYQMTIDLDPPPLTDRGDMPVLAGQWAQRMQYASLESANELLIIQHQGSDGISAVDLRRQRRLGSWFDGQRRHGPKASWVAHGSSARLAWIDDHRVEVVAMRSGQHLASVQVPSRVSQMAFLDAEHLIVLSGRGMLACVAVQDGGRILWQDRIPAADERGFCRDLQVRGDRLRLLYDDCILYFDTVAGGPAGETSLPMDEAIEWHGLYGDLVLRSRTTRHGGERFDLDLIEPSSGVTRSWGWSPPAGATIGGWWVGDGVVVFCIIHQQEDADTTYRLRACDLQTGRERWKRRSPSHLRGYLGRLPCDFNADSLVYCAYTQDRLVSLRLDDGREYPINEELAWTERAERVGEVSCRFLDGTTRVVSTRDHAAIKAFGAAIRGFRPSTINGSSVLQRGAERPLAVTVESRIADGRKRDSLVLRDLTDQMALWQLPHEGDPIGFSADHVVTGDDDWLRFIPVDGGPHHQVQLPKGYEASLADGRLFLCHRDGRLQEWDPFSARALRQWPWLPEGGKVLAALDAWHLLVWCDGALYRWSGAGQEWRLPYPHRFRRWTAWRRDGELAVIVRGQEVDVIDLVAGRISRSTRVGPHPVQDCQIVDGSEVLLACADGSAVLLPQYGSGAPVVDALVETALADVRLVPQPIADDCLVELSWVDHGGVVSLRGLRSGAPYVFTEVGQIIGFDADGRPITHRHRGDRWYRVQARDRVSAVPGKPVVRLRQGEDGLQLEDAGGGHSTVLASAGDVDWFAPIAGDTGLLALIDASRERPARLATLYWSGDSLQQTRQWELPEKPEIIALSGTGEHVVLKFSVSIEQQWQVLDLSTGTRRPWAPPAQHGRHATVRCLQAIPGRSAWWAILHVIEQDGGDERYVCQRWADSGAVVASAPVFYHPPHRTLRITLQPSAGQGWLAVAGEGFGRRLTLRSAVSAEKIAECYFWWDRQWAVLTPDGRWDGSLPAHSSRLHWREASPATVPERRRPGLLHELLDDGVLDP